MIRFPRGAHDDDVDSTSQALNYLRRRKHAAIEYIEQELAKEAERKLCWNPKCTNGEDGKRKKLEFNVPIYQVGAARYCSDACAKGDAAQGKPVPIWTGGTGGTSQFR